MDETYITKAIILNRQPFREADSKITVYSLDKGKLELIARGAKKIKSKLAGHLEPFCLSDLMIVKGKQFDYIGGAVSENCYVNIKNDLEKLVFTGKAISVFNRLVKLGEKDEAVFKLLQEILDVLNSKQKLSISYELLINFFVLQLMSQLGHKPELRSCVVCRKEIAPNGNKFDLSRGGTICLNCVSSIAPFLSIGGEKEERPPISADCIKVLRLVIESDFSRLTKLKINDILAKETKNIICSFQNYYGL
ncbi:MAG: DNA repair protein RecO [Patescibacteria group bacterium]|nr:DNA repair protein RecO [Patescibacteria group bacterium]